jgi:hypothetical protein
MKPIKSRRNQAPVDKVIFYLNNPGNPRIEEALRFLEEDNFEISIKNLDELKNEKRTYDKD